MNGSTTSEHPQSASIDEWTQTLCEQEMPIFSNTAHNIYATLDDEKKGAMELASIILQDPNLTAKLLRVSNSSYYNPSRQKINTVSRAIVILGAATIRELTLACAFFEAILSAKNKERASEEIANAIHAAVQAKQLAIATSDPSPEEVFIAALLNNIGKIAFWCFNDKQSTQILHLIESSNYTAAEAEKKILGFTLQQLSETLSHSWHLSGLIEQAINHPYSTDTRVQLVQLGHQINQAVKAGQDSEKMLKCLTDLAHLTGLNKSDQLEDINRGSAAAIKIAARFGAHDASRFIGVKAPERQSTNDDGELESDYKQLQFQILQEISSHISGPIDLNILFELVLEGIHRGVDMDNTRFFLLGANRKTLNEKLSIGYRSDFDKKMQIVLNDRPNLFSHCLQTGESLWAKPKAQNQLYTPQIKDSIGYHECFVIPVLTEDHVIGIICCDRSLNHRPLSQDDFVASQHFAKQAGIGLTLFRMRAHKP